MGLTKQQQMPELWELRQALQKALFQIPNDYSVGYLSRQGLRDGYELVIQWIDQFFEEEVSSPQIRYYIATSTPAYGTPPKRVFEGRDLTPKEIRQEKFVDCFDNILITQKKAKDEEKEGSN